MTEEEKYQALVEFVQVCASDGWLNTKGTARELLVDIGEKVRP